MRNSDGPVLGEEKGKVGVVLMTYGSATIAENVRSYFEHIYPGRASEGLITDFENRYRTIGRSPLIDITNAQAAALEQLLGRGYVVRTGMRHSDPTILQAVAECHTAGVESLVGIILAPQFSSFIMEGYKTAFMSAAQAHGYSDESAIVIGPWGTEPNFIQFLVESIKKSLAKLEYEYKQLIPVIFTTHSMPLKVLEKDPHYLIQLQETIDAVTKKLGPTVSWYAGYQSAGHSPEEWLKPDLTDLLAQARASGAPAVLIVPIQFLADHLEILYDLDIAAKAQCEDFGIAYHRTELPNIDPLFIQSLHQLVIKAVT